MPDTATVPSRPEQHGGVFRKPLRYDLLLALTWGGAERRYREDIARFAGLAPGEAVLDVGCGTGTSAIIAKQFVGGAGRSVGLDPSEEMLARARDKARRKRTDVEFVHAFAQAMPLPDATFDVVLSTTVIHCVPEANRAEALAEMRRVLKPDGRLVLVDFGGDAASKTSRVGRMRPHRHFDLGAALPDLRGLGFDAHPVEAMGFSDLHVVRATAC